jgi:uncharacterized membrane protein
MKGLAIASFVLGIIGFLLSFVFGLGLLASMLAIIFGIAPLVKRISKPLAISGLILGLLGLFISAIFLSQSPQDIIEQTREEISKEKTQLSK